MFVSAEKIDETGINVQFEESEDEDDEDTFGEVREPEDQGDEEEEGVEATLDATLHANVSADSRRSDLRHFREMFGETW